MGSINPPCDVDRLSDQNVWRIKELTVVVMTIGNDNNRFQGCACVRGTSLGVLSAGSIPIMVIGRIGGGGGPMGRSDWLRECCVVVVWPGGVRIGYIRRVPIQSSSTAAAPVTGSLVFSTLLDCLDEDCAAEFALCLLFCGTDCVWLARFGLFIRQVSVNWIMATDGAALVEGRAIRPLGRSGSCGGCPFGRCGALGVYPGPYWFVGRMLQKAEFFREEMFIVSVFWSRTRGDWIRICMMLLSSTWAMCLSRRFRNRSCPCSVSSGHLRSSATWCGYSKIWKRCARTPRNDFVRLNRVVVFTVVHG